MRTLPRYPYAFALFLAACGEPTPVAPPQPTEVPTVAPAPPPPPPPPAVTATATASAAPEAPPPRKSSGRPSVMKSDSKEISDSFGTTPGAKLELGDKDIATLRIPEGALRQATNITFKIDGRGKAHGQVTGKIYKITSLLPPGHDVEPSVTSDGDPFLLELPAGTKKNANLAIGVEDAKGRVKWTVVAPKRIDDARNMAIFELAALPSAYLHVTTKPPSSK